MRDPRKNEILQKIGIQRWELREIALSANADPLGSHHEIKNVESDIESEYRPDSQPVNSASNLASMNWKSLEKFISTCTQCALGKTRTQTVFGSGNPNAELLIIGEAPGAEEDQQGLPFVGKAGQLLTEMLIAIGLTRDQVYIANTLKCRPPHNRDPLAEEVSACEPYLIRQVELIQPKLILALGRIAAHNILKTTESLARLRDQEHVYTGTNIPVCVSYHPAYLLRSPGEKRKVWHDLKRVRARLVA